jgi:hypothetical protein
MAGLRQTIAWFGAELARNGRRGEAAIHAMAAAAE